jgi:hypothetical protein
LTNVNSLISPKQARQVKVIINGKVDEERPKSLTELRRSSKKSIHDHDEDFSKLAIKVPTTQG